LPKTCLPLSLDSPVLYKKGEVGDFRVFTGCIERRWCARQPVIVPRKPNVPQHLKDSPFSLGEARDAGLSLSALKGKAWRRLGFELYCSRYWREEKWSLLSAWQRHLPEGAVFSGRTAAAIHGLDFNPANPVEVIVPTNWSLRSSHGLKVRHCDLRREEVVAVRGLWLTLLERTLRDLCAQWPAEEALVALDMAVHLGLGDVVGLWRYARAAAGRPGAKGLRQLAPLAEPAESPMETRLRWLLIRAKLPRPQVQTDLHDRQGGFVGRADLYYPAARLVVEFDGGNHRERLVGDDRRQNELVNAGFTVLRFTSADLRNRPEVVVAQVRGAL
jgi:very-short-patch-repair endonuclease